MERSKKKRRTSSRLRKQAPPALLLLRGIHLYTPPVIPLLTPPLLVTTPWATLLVRGIQLDTPLVIPMLTPLLLTPSSAIPLLTPVNAQGEFTGRGDGYEVAPSPSKEGMHC